MRYPATVVGIVYDALVSQHIKLTGRTPWEREKKELHLKAEGVVHDIKTEGYLQESPKRGA